MNRLPLSLLFIIIVLAGCAFLPENGTTHALPDPTAIYKTVSAQLTASAQPVNSGITTPPPTSPSSTPITNTTVQPPLDYTATVTRTPVTPTVPCNQAIAGRPSIDISVADGTQFLPGQAFTKTWRLVNAGSCPWTREYAIVWFSGETLGKIISLPFTTVVQPGQSADVSVDFTAPQAPGFHQSNWMLRNAEGKLFGLGPTSSAPFWVRIEVLVVRTQTPTPQATLTATSTPGTVAQGTTVMILDKKLDLDTGKWVADASADLTMLGKPSELKLAALNGALIAVSGAIPPTLAICKGAGLKSDAVPISAELTNAYLCYRTNQSLPGYAHIKAFDPKEGKLTLEWVTWIVP